MFALVTRLQLLSLPLALLAVVGVNGQQVDVLRRAPLRHKPFVTSKVVEYSEANSRLEVKSINSVNGYLAVGTQQQPRWIHQSFIQPIDSIETGDDQELAESLAPFELLPADGQADDPFANRHLASGGGVPHFVRHREGYSVALDSRLRIPLWVQYTLRKNELSGPGDRDNSDFAEDESVPELVRVIDDDYLGSGFDRGHMAPAADMKRSQKVMDESFIFTNIAPQVGIGFNRHIWRFLEEATREWVELRGELTIITGPVFSPDADGVIQYDVIGENQIAVPNAFFKILLDRTDPQHPEAMGFLIPNEQHFGQAFSEFLVSIDQIEAATGIDFLSELSAEDQENIESSAPNTTWPMGQMLLARMRQAKQDVALNLVDIKTNGAIAKASQVDSLIESARQNDPTHIFVLAHGWNNSRSEARESYQSVLDTMGQVADRHNLRPQQYRPVVVGFHWPSKAWDRQSRRLHRAARDEDLTLAIMKVLPAEKSPNTYLDDVKTLRDLLNKRGSEVTPADRHQTLSILTRYSTDPQTSEDTTIFEDSTLRAASAAAARLSLRDMFRVFTFWQMKKRAGIAGRVAGRRVLLRLQREFPDAQLHLGGHSFGCKFLLSALAEPANGTVRPIRSLTLLQGAISTYAFAENVPGRNQPGLYQSVLKNQLVEGPIVATHSRNDWPLRFAYPVGSRMAGQTGELDARAMNRFAALGGVGKAGARQSRTNLKNVGEAYGLTKQFWSVNGDTGIEGHSDIYNRRVAWLIWSAILQR